MLTQRELILILEMRLTSLDNQEIETRNMRQRAEIRIRQKEVYFIIQHIKNKIIKSEVIQ